MSEKGSTAGVYRPRKWRELRDSLFSAFRDKYRPNFNIEVRQVKDGFDAGFEAGWTTAIDRLTKECPGCIAEESLLRYDRLTGERQ